MTDPPFNHKNLRLRFEDGFSYLGRLCHEFDPTLWVPDPATGEGHWTYGDEWGEVTYVNQATKEETVIKHRLGYFHLPPNVKEHYKLTGDQEEHLLFLNTLALDEGTDPWMRFNSLLHRITQ